MIFFGDSLSDIGNNTWVLMDGIVGTPITNPDPMNENKRYLWVNYLTSHFKEPVYPSNQLGSSSRMRSISYAYASADTSNHYLNADWPQKNTPAPFVNQHCIQPGLIKDSAGNIISTCVPGLLKQIDAYLNAVKNKPTPGSVFFIWAGGNDLLNYYTDYMSHGFIKKLFVERFQLPSSEALDRVEQQTVNNIMLAKKKLIDAGVKPERIYILDLPDLSKVPFIRSNHSWALKIFYGKENLERSLSAMSHSFNQKLQVPEEEIRYAIPASHYIRIGNLLNEIISNPSHYHLTNVTESCVAKQAAPLCSGYLFYNAKHATTFANKIIAGTVLSTMKNPEAFWENPHTL